MKGKRIAEEQIIGALKGAEAGAKTKDLCRRHGIADATLCNWEAKYGGMTVSEARRQRVRSAPRRLRFALERDAERHGTALRLIQRAVEQCLRTHSPASGRATWPQRVVPPR